MTKLMAMLRILQERGPMRAGDLGADMWLRPAQRYNDDASRRHCRAAGKMLRRAKALGFVRDEQRGPNHLWFATLTPVSPHANTGKEQG